MVSSFGDVLVAEHVPTLLPLDGLSLLAQVERDITAISQEYPWSALLRNRMKRGERFAWHRRELAILRRDMAYQAKIRDAQHELAADIRAKDKGRQHFLTKG